MAPLQVSQISGTVERKLPKSIEKLLVTYIHGANSKPGIFFADVLNQLKDGCEQVRFGLRCGNTRDMCFNNI
jgi:hypothetical protein